MKHTHEIVFFGFKSEVDSSDQMQMMSQLDAVIKKMEGFVSRDYFFDVSSKKWVDHVVWLNMECAKRAAQDVFNIPECSAIFSKIDQNSIAMGHYNLLGKCLKKDSSASQILKVASSYYLAFLHADSNQIVENFLPTASKLGAMYDYEKNNFMTQLLHHDLEATIEFAKTYNSTKHMPLSQPKLEILDEQDQTAIIKLTAEWATNRWGTDYVSLVKKENRWWIAGIVWQSILTGSN